MSITRAQRARFHDYAPTPEDIDAVILALDTATERLSNERSKRSWAEAERNYRMRENAELHESWLLLSSDTAAWQQRAVHAEARIQAVRNMCARASRDAGTLERNLLGGHRLYPKEILRALDTP